MNNKEKRGFGEMKNHLDAQFEKDMYYIPYREEFHIGFEYYREIIGQGTYRKYIWGHEPFKINGIFPDWLNRDVENCRIKYLDKQDIEELGWKLERESDFEFIFIKNNCTLSFIKNTKSMTIYQKGGSTNIPIFIGTIKNKSELKKLFKQLEIC